MELGAVVLVVLAVAAGLAANVRMRRRAVTSPVPLS
jgi:hypothetical protein